MKTLSLTAVLGLLLASQGFAGKVVCPEFDVQGTWKNGRGKLFQIDQASCSVITIKDIARNISFHLNLDGKTQTEIKGQDLTNAPAIVTYKYQGPTYTRSSTPLLQKAKIKGSLERVVDGWYSNGPSIVKDRKNAKLNILGTIRVPLIQKNTEDDILDLNNFLKIKASAVGGVSLYSYSTGNNRTVDTMYLSISQLQIESLIADQNRSIAESFVIMVLNSILKLPSLYSHDKDGNHTTISGLYQLDDVFRILDRDSALLERISR